MIYRNYHNCLPLPQEMEEKIMKIRYDMEREEHSLMMSPIYNELRLIVIEAKKDIETTINIYTTTTTTPTPGYMIKQIMSSFILSKVGEKRNRHLPRFWKDRISFNKNMKPHELLSDCNVLHRLLPSYDTRTKVEFTNYVRSLRLRSLNYFHEMMLKGVVYITVATRDTIQHNDVSRRSTGKSYNPRRSNINIYNNSLGFSSLGHVDINDIDEVYKNDQTDGLEAIVVDNNSIFEQGGFCQTCEQWGNIVIDKKCCWRRGFLSTWKPGQV